MIALVSSGEGGGHGAGGATGATVGKVDAARMLLASAARSYRCLLVGGCLSIEQQPPEQVPSSCLPEQQDHGVVYFSQGTQEARGIPV